MVLAKRAYRDFSAGNCEKPSFSHSGSLGMPLPNAVWHMQVLLDYYKVKH
jgi:hypothetical protein